MGITQNLEPFLIHNAIQAMGDRGKLTIAVTERNNGVLVQITDSGSGIPDEIKDKIFTPFFTTKPAGEVTGLRLDIVSKIIDKHQGTIEVASKPGNTVFNLVACFFVRRIGSVKILLKQRSHLRKLLVNNLPSATNIS